MLRGRVSIPRASDGTCDCLGQAVRLLASDSPDGEDGPVDPGKEPVMKRAALGSVDSPWTVTVEADARRERAAAALCSLAAGGFHDDAGGGPTRLPGPVWTGLEAAAPDGQDRRELDLHGGVLRRAWTTADGAALHSLRFVSLARPGVVGLRAEGPPGVLCAGPALLAPGNGVGFEEGRRGDIVWAGTRSAGGGGIT